MTKSEMKKAKGPIAQSSYAIPTSSSSQRGTGVAIPKSGTTPTIAVSAATPSNKTARSTTSKVLSPQSLSLQDLPEDEKMKVSRLVEKLIDLGNKHEETLQILNRERQEHDEAMNALQRHLEGQLSIIEDNMRIKDQKIIALETKENMMSSMLVLYQSKLRNISDIYLLTKHQDNDIKYKYQNLENELKHFQSVVQTQKQMIDSFDETKRQLELSYQMTIKPLQEKLIHIEKQFDDEKKLRIDYENQSIQYRTKNSLLEHELLTMQSQLQTLLTVTTKSTTSAVTAALTAMNDSATSSVSSSISSVHGLVGGNGSGSSGVGDSQEDMERLKKNEKLREILRNGAAANATLPPPPTQPSVPITAIPNRSAILPGKPTVNTNTAASPSMVSGGTQTNDGHYDDYSVMYNSSIDSSQINLHTLSVHDHRDDKGTRPIDVGQDDSNDSLLPTVSVSPIRKKKFKLEGLLKPQKQEEIDPQVEKSDEFDAHPLIKASADPNLKKATIPSSTGLMGTLRRKPMRIQAVSSFAMSSNEGGLNQNIESVESVSSPPLEYSPITPGTVFKHLQQPKSSSSQNGNPLRQSQASAVSADDPNSIYSSMYGDSEETMSTIDNSLDLNNSSLDILYPVNQTKDSTGPVNNTPNANPSTAAVDLNSYLELPSAIEPVRRESSNMTSSHRSTTADIPKAKGIAVMDTPSPSPSKQSYSLLSQLRPNVSSGKRSTSAPPAQRRQDNITNIGDDEMGTTGYGENKKSTTNGNNAKKKSTSIFDLFDGKEALKQQQQHQQGQQQLQGKKAPSPTSSQVPSTTRQPKSISFDDNVISHGGSSSHAKSHINTANGKKSNTPSPPQNASSSSPWQSATNKSTSKSPTGTTSIKVSIPTVNTIRKDTHRKETTLNPSKLPSNSAVKKTNGKKNLLEHDGLLYDESLFDLLEDLD